VAADTLGNAYVTGRTVSSDFPTTSGAYQRNKRGGTDAFITKFAFDTDSCSVSSDPQVKICTPQNEASVDSPVRIVAVTNGGHSNRLLQLYVDGSKKHQVQSDRLDHSVALAAGRHRITVQAVEDGAVVAKHTIHINVRSSTGDNCPALTNDPQVRICTPQNEQTVGSPVRVVAITNSGHSNRLLQLYVDGNKHSQVQASRLESTVSLSAGRHRLTAQALQNGAVIAKETIHVNVSP
jgi:hypothetical protein